jgi:hypothetical protein
MSLKTILTYKDRLLPRLAYGATKLVLFLYIFTIVFNFGAFYQKYGDGQDLKTWIFHKKEITISAPTWEGFGKPLDYSGAEEYQDFKNLNSQLNKVTLLPILLLLLGGLAYEDHFLHKHIGRLLE